MTTIPGNLQHVRSRIATACQRAGRGVEEVTLLAVSKTFGADAVRAAAAAGQRPFGESYSRERVEKIAERLSAQRPADRPPLNVCIQVNIDGGANKSGVAPGDALALARAVAALPQLKLRGLMSIPEIAPDFEAARAVHASARALFDQLNADGLGLDTLSMGMSDDLEAAIAAGSTMVRVGTAIFGSRAPKP